MRDFDQAHVRFGLRKRTLDGGDGDSNGRCRHWQPTAPTSVCASPLPAPLADPVCGR